MTLEVKNKILDSVIRCNNICSNSFSPDSEHEHDMVNVAYEILNLTGITNIASIIEIPLCENNEIVIRFCVNSNPTLSLLTMGLTAGFDKNNTENFFFEIYIEDDEASVNDATFLGHYLLKDNWKVKNGVIIG